MERRRTLTKRSQGRSETLVLPSASRVKEALRQAARLTMKRRLTGRNAVAIDVALPWPKADFRQLSCSHFSCSHFSCNDATFSRLLEWRPQVAASGASNRNPFWRQLDLTMWRRPISRRFSTTPDKRLRRQVLVVILVLIP